MSKKLKLTDREWGTFRIDEILNIEKCKCSKVSSFSEGSTPYVGATNRNNGVLSFVEKKDTMITKGNCLAFICDGEGSIGLSIYKYENFIGSTTVKVGRSEYLNKYVGMFLTTVADTVRGKYNFGYKRNTEHLSAEILQLPIQSDGAPDWEFMSNYMKQVEDELLSEVRPKLETQLLNHIINLGALEDREWRKFKIGNLFSVRIGKSLDGNKVNRVGQVAYITRKESDNGLDGFIDEDDSMLTDVYPVITIGNETAQPFVQVYPFFTGTKVNILIPNESIARDLYTLQFIAVSLAQHKGKYSYSYTINSSRLREQVVLLPVQSDGTPDWEFMSAFMQRVEQETLGKALQFFKLRCKEMQNRGGVKCNPISLKTSYSLLMACA